MKDLTLSLVQMRSILGRPDTNFKSMIDRIRNIASGGTDIICFPEASLTGYTSDRPELFSMPASDERVERIRRAAADHEVAVVFGFLEHSGLGYHVTQAVADSEGGLDFYRKTHLGRGERTSFIPGEKIRAFHTLKAEIGVQLCWESHFPEISCKLRKEGAELILIPYASPIGGPRRKDIWMRYIPARAADNCLFVAAVNAVGNGENSTFSGGGSIVFDPKGRMLGESFSEDEDVLTVNLFSKNKDALGSDADMGNIDYFIYRREELY